MARHGAVPDLEALQRTNDRLVLLVEQLSHDLRNPITALLASVELLADETAAEADPELAKIVANALASGHRMTALLDDALAQVTRRS